MRGNANDCNSPAPGPVKQFLTPPATRNTSPPRKWMSEKIKKSSADLFHVIHKVPAGDSPYVKAKRVQLIDKDPGRAVSLFWSAINAGDRVDSALKDMAVVMKQLDRSDEAIEAIKSFRHLCSNESQESLDNVLVELYKRSGRLDQQIEILQRKLKRIEDGHDFGGRKVKLARSQGKKVHITIEQEYARLLGNLAWAYLQKNDYKAAEEHYRKSLSIEFDRNKQCNLAICLMYMNKITEAKFLLHSIRTSKQGDESYAKSLDRAFQLLSEIESKKSSSSEHEKENFNGRSNMAFTPPQIPAKSGNLSTPFTQPRRGFTEMESWKQAESMNGTVNSLNRKLRFEKFEHYKLLPCRDSERKCSVKSQNGSFSDVQRQENSSLDNLSGLQNCTIWKTGKSGEVRSPFMQLRRGEAIEELDERNWKQSNANESVYHLHRKLEWENRESCNLSGPENQQNEGVMDSSGEVDCENSNEEDHPVYEGRKKSWADMVEEDEQEQNMKEILGTAFWRSIF